MARSYLGAATTEVGQISLGHSLGACTVHQKVEALSGFKVISVAAGDIACCAVTAAGELFTWGGVKFGRLGHGDKADQHVPRLVEALRGEWVVAVSAGACQIMAVTRGGSVFGWGTAGALGLPTPQPFNADIFEDVN